ncbi:hypothetical protein Hanom_Chr10g00934421 [Helianthus anomalus]
MCQRVGGLEEIGLGLEVSLRAYKGGIGGVGYGMPYIFAYIMINLHGKLGFRVLPELLLCHGDFRFGEQFIIYIMVYKIMQPVQCLGSLQMYNDSSFVWIIHSQSRKKRLCKKKCCCLRPYIIMHFHPYTVPYYTIPSPVST